MSDEDSDEEQLQDQQQNSENEDSQPIIFGGQVSRAPTQVTGLTNAETAKTLMTLSTAKVQTKPNTDHSKPSPYLPNSDLFKFSNPDRPADDLDTAKNQIYHNEPVGDQNQDPNMISSHPTFSRPTAARAHGSGNALQQRYAHHMTFKGDNSQQILFGRFTNKSSCCLLMGSAMLSLMFCYVAIVFLPQFGESVCSGICIYSKVPQKAIDAVMTKQVTVISGCDSNVLMFAHDNSTLSPTAMTWDELKEMDSNYIDSMYIGSVNGDPIAINCWEIIHSGDDAIMDGYVFIDDDSVWNWSASGWYLILSILMALFFVLIEWLFYSYNEIMIPRKDYRAYITWYCIRIGWMSFMFSVIISHSLMVNKGDLAFIIGDFDYEWVKANYYISTGFVALFLLICLCCCCFQESDGFNARGNPFSNPDDFGFERYFLPQSRMDMHVINDFEQGLGVAMCSLMLFIIGYLICGFVPFIEFLNGGLAGYTYFPYIVSIWFLSIIVMTFQMCWFVRAKCCGDAEDKRRAQMHDRQTQRAGTVPR